MSVKLVVVALLAAAATVAIADDPAQEPKKLTVMKGCNSNACTDCTTDSYELGKCVEKDTKYYKAMCDAQGAATLTEFASQEECNKPAGQGTPVTLPPKECTAEEGTSDPTTYHKVVCPAPGNGGDNPDMPVYNGPFLLVKKSCDDNCENCNVQHQEMYQANGTCFKVMPAGGPSGSQQGAGTGANRRVQGQEATQKYYKAECETLKVTFYTDDKCTQGEDGHTYPKECDTSKMIAECSNPQQGGGSTSAEQGGGSSPGDNSSSPGDNSSSPGDNSSSPGDNSSSPGDDGSSGGSPGGSPGGSGGSSGSSDDSSNNSTEGLGVSAVHSVGAFAVALLAMALMC